MLRLKPKITSSPQPDEDAKDSDNLTQRRIARERSARKEAERLLEERSRELFHSNEQLLDLVEINRAIVETAADAIITYDSEGKVRTFNYAAEQMFARSRSCPLRIDQVFVDDKATHEKLFPVGSRENDREGSDPDSIKDLDSREMMALRSGGRGEAFPVEVGVARIQGSSENLYVAIIRDLSRRRVLEQRLRQAQKLESVGQLAAGIAHEINTPIQFVGDNLRFLQGAFGDLRAVLQQLDELRQWVAENLPNNDKLARVEAEREKADLDFLLCELPAAIEQSLAGVADVARIVGSMKEFAAPCSEVRGSVDLNRSILNTISVAATRFRQQVQIEAQLDDSLPEISGYGSLLNEVWLNLLDNAVEATQAANNGRVGHVVLTSRLVGDWIEVAICDNGCGIPDDVKERMFDPFFTTKEVGQGVGQGLSFVYDTVVNKHQGTIQVNSRVGEGATVQVRFPYCARGAQADCK